MPPPSRFGASKFRNAVPTVPHRDEFYRGSLPSPSSSSSPTSTFSSEIKTNRKWIVTVSSFGELSYRRYGQDSAVGRASGLASGGSVCDWDLSRLEDGTVVIGGQDGSVSIHTLPTSTHGDLEAAGQIPASGSAVSTLALQPTTPSILLVSWLNKSPAIYDLSNPSSPSIELSAKEPKGLWHVAWSTDGKLVAGVGKSGTAYLWDPRKSPEPITSKSLLIQALKPCRVAWIGDDIFLSAVSKTRNREYSLLSSRDLSTQWSQSIDTNTAPLIPLVDHERRIVYLGGRGDMSIRQIELSGPNGYQETIHSLPFPISSTGLALTSPTELEVMKAEIARVLVPVVDKDGDALLPFSIRVPRKQLIDYHDDLFPDVMGTLPEQTAAEWLKGEDKVSLPISLDPSRRQMWEKDYAGRESVKPTSAPQKAQRDADPTAAEPTPLPTAQKVDETAATSAAQASRTQNENVDRLEHSPNKETENTASTSYKSRIIGDHIIEQHKRHQSESGKGPLFAGLQGPQGCGKTTLANSLVEYLSGAKLKAVVLSLDDLYRTHDGLKEIAEKHPNNQLLSGRGPPGTHDVELANSVLKSVQSMGPESEPVELPIFDKSLFNGEGDRSKSTVKVESPLDIFVLEGWSMGFSPLSEDQLMSKFAEGKNAVKDPYFTKHSLADLSTLNDYLAEFAKAVYPFFHAMIAITPTDYEDVFKWRLQQEHQMKEKNGGKGMTDEEVRKFVERYMPGYELWVDGIWDVERPWAGRGLKLVFGSEREVLSVERPGSDAVTSSANKHTSLPSHRSSPPPQTSSASISAPSSSKPSVTPATPVKKTAAPTKTSQAPYNPSWSRKFLAGKAPLIPSYDSVPPLATLHPDSQILKATPVLAFFAVQGTGSRLAVHPLAKKGRMKLGGEGYLSNSVGIADFAVELFGDGRVAIAGDDGAVRVWSVPSGGIGGTGPEPDQILKGKGVDKLVQVDFHPTAKDLLVAASNDSDGSHLRFFDLSTGDEVSVVTVPAKGIYNFAFSPLGDRVAVAKKDGTISVLDPRKPNGAVSGKAHDSPRSFQLAWINPTHLVSVGFSRGSQRKVQLYSVESEIKTIASILIDTSPSVLFLHYDPDTAILYVWGKGERVIHAFEVHSEAEEPLQKLPSYTSGEAQLGVTWLPKRTVDVRKVEVAKVLRITAKAMEEVSFTIPRNKFFQDDIYIDTIDMESPSTTASEWLKGDDADSNKISLMPEGMKLLSDAPKGTPAKAKFVPAKDVLSEAEKKKREMDALFAKAKADESDEEVPMKGLAPPDDDW